MKSPDEIKKELEDAHKSCYLAIELGDPLGYPTAVYASYEATGNALALIQQLEARVPRWISVEERVPEMFRRVLCSDGERVFQAIYTTGSRYFPDHWEEVVCLEQNSCSTEHMHEPPTHWMPLPEPPKEE